VAPTSTPPVLAMDILEELRQLDSGGPFLTGLVDAFRADAGQKIASLQASLRTGDLAATASLAHSVGGAARAVGAARAGGAAKELQTAADSRNEAEARRLVGMLEREVEQALDALDRFVGR
jgi:HPt (histidine-containing phosphotransfer) domain-containing protein